MEKNVLAFDNAIAWIEVARTNFDALKQIIKDEAKALEDVDIRDLDEALTLIPKPRKIAERDSRIWMLQKDNAILRAHFT